LILNLFYVNWLIVIDETWFFTFNFIKKLVVIMSHRLLNWILKITSICVGFGIFSFIKTKKCGQWEKKTEDEETHIRVLQGSKQEGLTKSAKWTLSTWNYLLFDQSTAPWCVLVIFIPVCYLKWKDFGKFRSIL